MRQLHSAAATDRLVRQRWIEVERLFFSALGRPASERQGFLERECSDSSLRNSVASLLERHDSQEIAPETIPLSEAHIESLTPGASVGYFHILRELGRGGMGQVWLAEDTRLNRPVALKILSLSEAESSQAGVLREARAAAALRDENVVAIYDIGEVSGHAYIVSEFVEGGTLRARLQTGPLTRDDVHHVVAGLLSALQASHKSGVIHRDLKPENVLLTAEGVVKLTDFGLAVVRAASSPNGARASAGEAGAVIGTPSYMSPEQARGEPVDQRTDIWSLGVVIFEMVMGRVPFEGPNTAHVLRAIQEQSLPSDLERRMPAALARIIRRAIAKEKNERYETVEDFAREWERLGNRRARSGLYAVVAAALFLALTIGGLWWVRVHGEDQPTKLGPMRRLTTSGDLLDAVISPDGAYSAFVREHSERRAVHLLRIRDGEEHELTSPIASNIHGLAFSRDSRNVYYTADNRNDLYSLYRVPVRGGPALKLLTDIDSPVSFSPATSEMVFVRADAGNGESALMLATPGGEKLRKLAVLHAPEEFLLDGQDWEAGGRRVLCPMLRADGKCTIARIGLSGSIERLPLPPLGWIGRLARFGNENRFLMTAGRSVLSAQVFEFRESPYHMSELPVGPERCITISSLSNGSAFLVLIRGRTSSIWIQPKHQPPRRITSQSGRYYNVSWIPGDGLLTQAALGAHMRIMRMSLDGSEHMLLQSEASDTQPRASPDGRLIAFASDRDQVLHVWRANSDGSNPQQLTFGSAEDMNPEWSPDGNWIYFDSRESGTIRIRKIAAIGGAVASVAQNLACRKPVPSPDGTRIACECSLGNGPWQIGYLKEAGAQFHLLRAAEYEKAPLRWVPGKNAISFVSSKSGTPNIVAVDLANLLEKQITLFNEGRIFEFGWNSTGTALAVVRGEALSDAVLVPRAP